MQNPYDAVDVTVDQADLGVIASAVCFVLGLVLLFVNIYRRNGSPAWTCTVITLQSITALGLGYLLGSGRWRK